MKKSLIILVISFLICSINAGDQELTAKIQHEMYRLGDTILSVDGNYLIYIESKWTENPGKTADTIKILKYKPISGGEPKEIIESVSNPEVTSLAPNKLFFTKGGQIFVTDFPPKEGERPKQLTNYPLSINNFKIGYNSILFTADVYFKCETMECSSKEIEEESKRDWEVYDHLFVYHWDKWVQQGKGSHLFLQKIKIDESNEIVLDGEAKDLNKGMEINIPFFEEGKNQYDVSKDGTMAAFSGHMRDSNEAISTSWKTYFIIFNEMNTPFAIPTINIGRTSNPVFNLDNTKIAYLSMKTPMVEADNNQLEIYNILTNKVEIVKDTYDLSVTSFMWVNDNTIYYSAHTLGVITLFKVNFRDFVEPIVTNITDNTTKYSYNGPFTALKNRKIILVSKVRYDYPTKIVRFQEGKEDELILDNNEGFDHTYFLSEPEKFFFEGADNDKVQGWIFKPRGYEEGKKYPIALLIHGGPEVSWSTEWAYRWNPQIWANHGFVVLMLNPHGSTGTTTEFRNKVRNNWGNYSFEDIIKGLKYVNQTFNFADVDRTCACGRSYGGYMVNWLQGHPDNFTFKCFVMHDGVFSGMAQAYATDELWFVKSEFCPRNKIDCHPSDPDARKIIERYSAERHVDKWKIPMLVIQGGIDYRVPLTEALGVFTSCQLKGVPSKFAYFPLENHHTLKPENAVAWYATIMDWMDKYVYN